MHGMHYLIETISQLASLAILVTKYSSNYLLSVLICYSYVHVGFVIQLAITAIKILYTSTSYKASYAPKIHVNIILIHCHYTLKIKYPVINKHVLETFNFAFYNGSRVAQELNKCECSYQLAQQLVSYQNTVTELQVLTISLCNLHSYKIHACKISKSLAMYEMLTYLSVMQK